MVPIEYTLNNLSIIPALTAGKNKSNIPLNYNPLIISASII